MDPAIWTHATLLTSKGGLGVRCLVDLVIPAFLASSYATADLVSSTLSHPGNMVVIYLLQRLWIVGRSKWVLHHHQKKLEADNVSGMRLALTKVGYLLKSAPDPKAKVHLLATAESGTRLNSHLGTKLDNNSIHIATRLRSGEDIVEEHT